jgi:LmbE family N-acetylglucosaminyl deacetylase
MMRSRLAAALAALAALVAGPAAPATATEPAMNAGELAHALDRLAHTARVLYVAAHPDDENTRLLATLANGRHLTVAYLSMTRGGGGQNLIGGEQGELLDVIRTDELLAARRIDGAQQRFTRMRDFGYSKSAGETLARWGHDEALADVVWVIRSFQPDVIITRFNESPPNHGQHTASAILAREAFAAAADAARFPEQLERGVTVWKTERLLYNVPSWRDAPPPPRDALEIDVGGYDTRLGLGYGELAALSRSQHKSQGFGVPGERGKIIERLVPLAGSRPARDILEGIDDGWGRFGAAAAPYRRAIDEARAALERDRPARAVPALARAHAALDALPDVPRVRDARRGVERVMASAAGLFVRATAPQPLAVPGGSLDVTVEVVARSPARVALARVALPGAAAVDVGATLAANEKQLVAVKKVAIPDDAAPSVPYYLGERTGNGRYAVRDLGLVGQAKSPPALAAGVELTVEGRALRLEVPVVHAWTDPVHGERVRDLLVAPPATVTPARQAVLLPNGRAGQAALRVRAARDGLRGTVELPLPAGWKSAPPAIPVELARAGEETTVTFEVSAPRGAPPIEIHPLVRVDGKTWSLREDVIDYPHIPLELVLAPASLRLVPLALELPRGAIGYVRGSGDSVAEDLAHAGARVEELDDATLRGGDLARFAAIVVGIRAYNTRGVLRSAHARLMEYVERGGVVVAQYNTNNFLASLSGSVGPYPLEIGRGRITDENAAVTAVDPASPLLRAPNRLGEADWAGWVQERGVYYAQKWDGRYRPLLRMADPGEDPLEGAVLVAAHGKGRYVYTGLAFFRQLPAGVPGAYRLFANLIAGGKR